MTAFPTAADIDDALARLTPYVRRTPVLFTELAGIRVALKLEQLQIGGSFKVRGALNRLLMAAPSELDRGVVTASGGNHGIGVALAAKRLGHAATVYIPDGAPAATARRIEATGARCVRHGASFDDAWQAAREHAAAHGGLVVHAFDDPSVVAGQATCALEMLEDAPDIDGFIIAIGGGGLAAGTALAVAAHRPGLQIVGVEPTGAASMKASFDAGRVVGLDEVKTIAGTLAPRRVSQLTYEVCVEHLRELVLVTDEEMRAAMRLLWDDLRVVVEPAGAAAVAALVSGRMRTPLQAPAIFLCGANPEDAEVRRLFGGTV